MKRSTETRERLLRFLQMLFETDKDHPINTTQVIKRLKERYNIETERKALYVDVDAMRNVGVPVRVATNGTGYYLTGRIFTGEELDYIVDAVYAYRWIPDEVREAIMEKLAQFAPPHGVNPVESRYIYPNCHGLGDVETLHSNLNAVFAAKKKGMKLRFRTIAYDAIGNISESPYAIRDVAGVILNEGRYWVAFDSKVPLFVRVDHLRDVIITGVPAEGNPADLMPYVMRPFGFNLYRKEAVKLWCNEIMAGEVIDRFDDPVLEPEGDGFTVSAEVIVGPEFLGWVLGHSGTVKLLSPAWMANKVDRGDNDG